MKLSWAESIGAMFPVALSLLLSIRLYRLLKLDGRAAVLSGVTSWAALLVVITDVVSPFHALTRPVIAGLWFAISGFTWWLGRRFHHARYPVHLWPDRCADRVLFGVAGTILSLVLLIAWSSPPNTTDAQTYHLPRVVFWAQQAGVGNFPTNYFPQLQQPPGAEYLFLHSFVLTGTDRLINLVSWGAFLLCAVAASRLAALWGASSVGQWLAALLVVTLPGAILEASGPKNDVTAACWLLVSVVCLVDWGQSPRWLTMVTAGEAFGLALLTKGTIYVFGPPVLLTVVLLVRPAPRLLLRQGVVFVLAVIVLNAGFWSRNIVLTGSPLGVVAPREFQPEFTNSRFGLRFTVSNVLRNLALHAVLPGERAGEILLHRAQRLHDIIGVSLNDPATTWPNTEFRPSFSLNEAEAGDLLFVVLLFAGLAAVAIERRSLPRAMRFLLPGIAVAFLVFCALLKWQPWHARLHLPLLLVSAAPLGLWLDCWPRPAALAAAAVLTLGSIPYLLMNSTRPLLGHHSVLTNTREAGYGNDDPGHWTEYLRLALRASQLGCRDIGLDNRIQPAQYVYLHILASLVPGVRFQNAAVENESRRYQGRQNPPCAILCPWCAAADSVRTQHLAEGMIMETIGSSALFVPVPARVETSCGFRFGEGWYPAEQEGQSTLHWTPQSGTLRIRSPEDREVEIATQMISPLVRGAVDVIANGVPVRHFERSAFLLVPVHLLPGENIVRFASVEPGKVMPPDPRTLAFGLRDLQVLGGNYDYVCSPAP